jgi:hypothetical protein
MRAFNGTDPSVDPLSHTIARKPSGNLDNTYGSARDSLRRGSTTSITRPDYASHCGPDVTRPGISVTNCEDTGHTVDTQYAH